MKQKCLNCKSWERNYDPCVGWCQSFNGWRFQFEGNDCEDYEFFEERAPGKPSYLPEPKKASAKRGTYKDVIEQNGDRIRKLRKEGKSYYSIARAIGISERSSDSVRRWLKNHPEEDELPVEIDSGL
jgi:hypothetical protein